MKGKLEIKQSEENLWEVFATVIDKGKGELYKLGAVSFVDGIGPIFMQTGGMFTSSQIMIAIAKTMAKLTPASENEELDLEYGPPESLYDQMVQVAKFIQTEFTNNPKIDHWDLYQNTAEKFNLYDTPEESDKAGAAPIWLSRMVAGIMRDVVDHELSI